MLVCSPCCAEAVRASPAEDVDLARAGASRSSDVTMTTCDVTCAAVTSYLLLDRATLDFSSCVEFGHLFRLVRISEFDSVNIDSFRN